MFASGQEVYNVVKTETLTQINSGENQIVVYQPDETIRLDVRLENETVWLTQAQLCALFQRDVSVISRHIRNIFSEGELDKEGNLHFCKLQMLTGQLLFTALTSSSPSVIG